MRAEALGFLTGAYLPLQLVNVIYYPLWPFHGPEKAHPGCEACKWDIVRCEPFEAAHRKTGGLQMGHRCQSWTCRRDAFRNNTSHASLPRTYSSWHDEAVVCDTLYIGRGSDVLPPPIPRRPWSVEMLSRVRVSAAGASKCRQL